MVSKVITIYDAHTALINARFDKAKATFEKFEAKVDASIKGALLKGLAWMTVLFISTFSGLLYVILTAK
jgi:hypothetical protein